MNRYYLGHEVGVVLVSPPSIGRTWKIYRDKPESFHDIEVKSELISTNKLYLPNPSTFTGRIAELKEFQEEETNTSKKVMGKVRAEGCEITKGNAFAISSADCYTVVISHLSGFMIAFNAGLKSLVDFELIFDLSPSRKNFSVIDSAMEYVKRKNLPLNELHVSIHCGIGSEYYCYPYNHPQFAGSNKTLLRFLRKRYGRKVSPTMNTCENGIRHKIHGRGHLNLVEIIYSQFDKFSVDASQIYHDKIDTGPREICIPDSEKPKNNEFVSAHMKTDYFYVGGKRELKRNLIMVWHLNQNWSLSAKSEYT